MLLIISNIPTPYRIPLFNTIHERLSAQGKQVQFVFAAESHAFRKWKIDIADFKFNYQYLSKNNTNTNEKTKFYYQGLFLILRQLKPSVVVVPGFSVATAIAVIGKLFFNYKLVVWSGTTNNPNRKISWVKLMYRKLTTPFVNEYIVYGTAAQTYIEQLDNKAATKTITKSYNTVAVNKFNNPSLNTNYNPCQLLYVGNFTKGKQVHRLIEIALQLQTLGTNFNLTLIGSGETFTEIQTSITQHNLHNCVTLIPHLQKDELIQYYHASQVFLFPSQYDVWGLVVNEAMAAGLCVFASTKAGATQDLIAHNTTGFAVNYDAVNDVALLLHNIILQPQLLTSIRVNAQHYILHNITIPKAAEAFVELMN